jgi:hypothetical protein
MVARSWLAVQHGDENMAEFLLDQRACLDSGSPRSGLSALRIVTADLWSHSKMLVLVLRRGIDVNIYCHLRDPGCPHRGLTALHLSLG